MDINCDLGEGISGEEAIMSLVDSCSIACGGHYGDADSMIKTLTLAQKFGVKAGAHPSYIDPINFGRKVMDISPVRLKQQIMEQISTLDQLSKSIGLTLHHVKAHGALYNEAARNKTIGNVLIDSVVSFGRDLCIFVPYASNLHQLAIDRNVKHWIEVFADRNYRENYELISRGHENAVILEPLKVKNRVRMMVQERQVKLENGQGLPIEFDTICVHGDHPKAFEIVKGLNALKQESS
ncbi:5-oxoprolinase subunit PxpA [Lutimonas sp.]|uniref:5-oxoprolinase subunit PxpA n=1 Tax=Lutimonas sp. TaxID=1872403 RepID=UPI003D9B233A